MVPEPLMKANDLCRLDLPHLFEVDERSVVGAENPIELQKVKSTA
jgi:hypothetical protein